VHEEFNVHKILIFILLPVLLWSYTPEDFMFPGAKLLEKPYQKKGVVTIETVKQGTKIKKVALFGNYTKYLYAFPTTVDELVVRQKLIPFLRERIEGTILQKNLYPDEGFFLFEEKDRQILLRYKLLEDTYSVDLTEALPTPQRISLDPSRPFLHAPRAGFVEEMPKNVFMPHILGYHIIEAQYRPSYTLGYYLHGRKIEMEGRYWHLTYQKIKHDRINMCYWMTQNYLTLLRQKGARVIKNDPCQIIFRQGRIWGRFSAKEHTVFLDLLEETRTQTRHTLPPKREAAKESKRGPTAQQSRHVSPATPRPKTLSIFGSVYRSAEPAPEGYYDYLYFVRKNGHPCVWEGASFKRSLAPERINLAIHGMLIKGRMIDVDRGVMKIEILNDNELSVRDFEGRTRRFIRLK